MTSLREWLAERAARLYAAAEGTRVAAKRLRGRVEGREVAELVGDEVLVEMLLGGFDPESSEPYRPGSLARLYRDLYGLQVLSPRLLALRLRDGLPLQVAGRGIRVAWGEARFLSLASRLAEAAAGLLRELGAEKPEPLEYDLFDPLWGLEAARRLVEEALALLPPASREAMTLFAASAPAPLGVVERLGGSREELEQLGCRYQAAVYGAEAPGQAGALRLLCSPQGAVASYRCLALGAARLAQLDELRGFIEAPDPVAVLVEEAAGELDRDRVTQLASAAQGLGQRLPAPRGCGLEAPVLPMGYWSYRLEARLEDVALVAGDGGQLSTYMEAVEALAPLLYRGLAGLEPGEDGVVAWFVAWQQP
jgi:hypothetical protein